MIGRIPPRDGAGVSRREILRVGALGGVALALDAAVARAGTAGRPLSRSAGQPTISLPVTPATFDFNQGWRFGGVYVQGSQDVSFSDERYASVTLPHTVAPLSWGGWNPTVWEQVWIYRKHFSGAELTGGRVFVDFDGVMTNATVYLNGIELAEHQGGSYPGRWS